MVETSQVFGILNASLNLIATGIFFAIIFTAAQFRRERGDVSLILTINSCVASLLTCLAMCIMLASNFWNGFLTYNYTFCLIAGFFYDICQCAIYHSYFLQAFFRLCRVVFYRKKSLLSFPLYQILILIQWCVTIVVLLPPVLLRWYTPLSAEKYCLVPYIPIAPAMYHITVLYLIPLVCISTMYRWISIYIRRSTRATAQILSGNQKRRNQRDLTMIKRIIIMISVLVLMRLPTLVFIINAIAFGFVHPVAFSVTGSIVSLCLIFIGLINIYFTPKFQNNLCSFVKCRENRVDIRTTIQEGLQGTTTTDSGKTRPQLMKSRIFRTNPIQEPSRSIADAPIATIT